MKPHRPFEHYYRSWTQEDQLAFAMMPLPFRMAVRSAWDAGHMEEDFQYWTKTQHEALRNALRP